MPELHQHITRARILLDQRQYAMAEDQLRTAIGEHPEVSLLYTMLASCLMNLDRLKDAESACRRAIELEPDGDEGWYVLSLALSLRGKDRAAIEAANRAVDLDPSDPDNWWVLGVARMRQNELKAALEAAEHGLTLDAGADNLLLLRDRALAALGRPQAVEHARETLARDPESDVAHNNLGWALLHAGQHQEAVVHFREALRLDPEFEHPREGIIEALKARSWLYRQVLRVHLLSKRQTQRTHWVVIILFIVVMVLSKRMITWTPQFAPVIHVFRGVILAACFVLMFSEPLFNLVLRFDPLGKHALSTWHRRMAVVLGTAAAPAAVAGVAAALTDSRDWNRLFVVFLLLACCVAIVTDVDRREHRRLASYVLAGIFVFSGVMLLHYFVVPLGGPGLLSVYIAASFIGAGGFWFWSSFLAKDE